MKSSVRIASCLAGLALVGGCGTHGVVVVDGGLVSSIAPCNFGTGDDKGFVNLFVLNSSDSSPSYHLQRFTGGAFDFPASPSTYEPTEGVLGAFCGSNPAPGQCCVGAVPSPGVRDAGSSLGVEYITCQSDHAASSGSAGVSNPYGSLSWTDWSSGDSLNCSGDGGVTAAFNETVATPSSVLGLSPALFPGDGGTVNVVRVHDLAVTWKVATVPSNVVINLQSATTRVACIAADDGSFNLPESVLAHFQSGDTGSVTVFRYKQTCAQKAQVSFLIEDGVQQTVTFQ